MLSQDSMMEAWLGGRGRSEYVCALSKEVNSVSEDEWQAAGEMKSPCMFWGILKGCMNRAGASVFPNVKLPGLGGQQEHVQRRHDLLQQRAVLRQQLDGDDGTLESVQLELVLLSRRLRLQTSSGRGSCS